MTRVVMIGIDGLDADLVRIYGPSLPHLRLLMLESPFLELETSFSGERGAAWASGYDGETFWNRAEQAGKRVCVLMEHSSQGRRRAGLRSTKHVVMELQERLMQQAEQALYFLQREAWDLFFWQTDILHSLQEYAGWYVRANELVYPEHHSHTQEVLEFYRLFDTLIEQFRSGMEKESIFIVVSSYGQRWCCAHQSRLMKWLCKQQASPVQLLELLKLKHEVQVDEGVFLLGNLPSALAVAEGVREPTVKDVASTVLALLGIGEDEDRRSRHEREAWVQPLLAPAPMLVW